MLQPWNERASTTGTTKRALTLLETMVVTAIIGILTSVLLPAIGGARDAALQCASLSNLRQLSAATAAYASDWSDRQFTMIPDDFCQSMGPNGNCSRYIKEIGCIPHPTLGWTTDESTHTRWAFWIDEDNLCAERGSCTNIALALPYDALSRFGSFRLINASPFAAYLGGRFYDRVFYAPKDRLKAAQIESMSASEQALPSTHELAWSSYCLSASALFNPEVWDPVRAGGGLGFTEDRAGEPCTPGAGGGPGGLKAPPLGMATYPELKTHMLEHEWLQNVPGRINPLFSGGQTPYFFNQGIASAPCTLFYDGSVRTMSVKEVIRSEHRLAAQQTQDKNRALASLWCSDWIGQNYFENQGYGLCSSQTSYHVMTRYGIKGRDTIRVE